MASGASYNNVSADGHARQHNGNAYNTNTYSGNASNTNTHHGNNNYNNTTGTHHGNVFQGPTNNYNMSESPNPFAQIMMSAGQPTQLHKASAKGDEGLVLSLLERGDSIEAHNDSFMTPLQVAVQKNQIGIARLLLSRGANVDARYRFWTASELPVLLAIANRNEEIVRLLVDHGADIEESGFQGMTALGLAAKDGLDGIVAFLLSKGANTKIRAAYGNKSTPLQLATAGGHAKTISLLQQNRASGGTAIQPETRTSAPESSRGPTQSTQHPATPPQPGNFVSQGPQQSQQYQPAQQHNPPQSYSPSQQDQQHLYQPPQLYQQSQQSQSPQQFQSSPAISPTGFSPSMTSSTRPPNRDFSRLKPGLTKLWKQAKPWL